MSLEFQMKIAKSRVGRMVLHITALLRDGKYSWHLKGITRELCI